MRFLLIGLALTTLLLCSPRAGTAEPSGKRRAAALGASLLPGSLVHGTGQFSLGRSQAGLTLLGMQAAGGLLIAAGGVPLNSTNASRYLVVPSGALIATGIGLVLVSWVADVYSSMVDHRRAGIPELVPPDFEVAVGFRRFYNPAFGHRGFVVAAGDLRHGRLRAQPSTWLAVDDRNSTGRLAGSYRLYGPLGRGQVAARDGTHFDLELAATRASYASDGFTTWTIEASAAGRLDSGRLSALLRGTFLDLGLGYARQHVAYQAEAAAPHWEDLLLLRTGVGVYFGDPRRIGGEAVVFYDNRHDSYAGGLKIYGIAGEGVFGHVGLSSRVYFARHWGLVGDASFGSARIYGLSLLHRR